MAEIEIAPIENMRDCVGYKLPVARRYRQSFHDRGQMLDAGLQFSASGFGRFTLTPQLSVGGLREGTSEHHVPRRYAYQYDSTDCLDRAGVVI